MNAPTITTNTFCGPAALSIILGKDTAECEKLIKSVRRPSNKPVRGVYLSELAAVLEVQGYKVEYQRETHLVGRSLFFSMTMMKEDGLYIFLIPHHFVVIEKDNAYRYICDNHTKTPINAATSARLNQVVLDCFKVSK